MANTDKREIKCSFCGRSKSEVNVLIAGVSGHICDSCILQAQSIIKEELSQKAIAEKQTAEADVLRNRQLALFGGLGLVILFSIYIYSRLRVIRKQKSIIEDQKGTQRGFSAADIGLGTLNSRFR